MKNSCPTIFFSFRQIRLPLARTHQLIWKRIPIPTWKFTPQSRKFRRRNRAFWIHGTTLIRCHIDFGTWVILFDHRQLLTWLLYMTLENKPTSYQFYLFLSIHYLLIRINNKIWKLIFSSNKFWTKNEAIGYEFNTNSDPNLLTIFRIKDQKKPIIYIVMMIISPSSCSHDHLLIIWIRLDQAWMSCLWFVCCSFLSFYRGDWWEAKMQMRVQIMHNWKE